MQASIVKTHLDGAAAFTSGITDLEVVTLGGAAYLVSVSGATGGISTYAIDTGGVAAAQLEDQESHATNTAFGFAPVQVALTSYDGTDTLTTFGGTGLGLAHFDVTSGGDLSAPVAEGVGLAGDGAVVGMEWLTLGAETYVYAAHYLTGGLSTYRVGASGLTGLHHLPGAGGFQGVDVTAMATQWVGAEAYVFTTSTVDNSVSAHKIGSDGLPTTTGTTGAAQGLGLAAPTALATAEVAGTTFVIVAGAGSSSLSVMQLTSGGSLVPTDHVLDGLHTRFQGVQALEVVTVAGQTFVLAGGADDGISLLSLLPDGRLLHRLSVADTATTSLANVNCIAAVESDGDLAVFVSSAIDTGITEFRIDLGLLGSVVTADESGGSASGGAGNNLVVGQSGADVLSGGSGDDILMDGAGIDILTGGAGADVFVFSDDGLADFITDYDPGADALDLSGFGLLYSVAQLTVQSTASGATLTFFSEVIHITSHDGLPLDTTDFQDATITNIQRIPLWGVVVDQSLIGTEAADTLIGGAGDDTISGGPGADVIDGGDGHDTVTFADAVEGVWVDLQNPAFMKGDALGDVILDVEILIGSGKADQLRADSADNELYGGGFSDRLYGRAGNDLLFGEGGADALYGNTGADVMTGGSGAVRDRFIYFHTVDSLPGAGARDVITDFQTGIDRIEISRFDADPRTPGNQAFAFIAVAAFGDVGQVRYEQDAAAGHTLVQADLDGDGTADFEIELTGLTDLIAGDFLL